MKKSKFLLLIGVAGLLGLGVSGTNYQSVSVSELKSLDEESIKTDSRVQKAPISTPKKLVEIDGADVISDATSFSAFFNNTGHNRSAYLTADIDMGGVDLKEIGVHGEYIGVFEGNGFTVSNFKSGVLFNIIGESGEIRNINLRKTIRNSSAAGIAFQSKGLIENVNIEVIIDTVRDHVGGFTRSGGGGKIKDSKVDFTITSNGAGSKTNLNAICYEGSHVLDNVSYYLSGPGADDSTITVPTGVTLRTDPINWSGSEELPPRVEVTSGYTKNIYVEIDPKTTEVTASVYNAEGKTVAWGVSDLVGEEYGSVEVDENEGVATITAIAKGKVSFKFKATIDEVEYLSSVVEITVLNNDHEYVIPANAIEIGTVAQFKQFFDKAASHNNSNGVLINDIDLNGYELGQGMAGEYSGIFEGQGHKISNFKGKGLFNIIKPGSEVRNVKVEIEPTMSAGGIIASINHGLVKNVSIMAFVKVGINSYGGISQIGSGEFVNCHVDWIFSGDGVGSNTIHAIVQDDSGKKITNCSWTQNGSTSAVVSQGNAEVTHNLPREGALGFSLWIMEYEDGDISTAECGEKWGLALIKWKVMIDDAKEQVRTESEFAPAWSRLQAWALANNVSDIDEAAAAASIDGNLSKKNTFSAGLLVGAIGITTMMSYYLLSKKKKHN